MASSGLGGPLLNTPGTAVKELNQYQRDNFDLLVVFDNRKVMYMIGFGLVCFGVGIAAGLAFAFQADHV